MIIGVDGNEANVQNKVGISEYAFELLSQFEQFKIQNSKFKVYLKDRPRSEMPKSSNTWKYRVLRPKKLWTQWRLPLDLYLSRPRPSVFFTPSHYAPRFSPIPTAISIMDVSYLHFPELFKDSDLYQLTSWTAYSAKKAARIFTISQASKNDIMKAYSVPEERVVVTYPGIKNTTTLNPRIYAMHNLHEKYHIGDKYILFVGTLQPRKNIERLIEAYSILVKNKKHAGTQLVIVGKKGWLYEPILAAPQKYDVVEHVQFLDFVDDQDLSILYKNALFFILPSLYEGFGLPVLEAMKHGCPVITSSISSLPEAGGDAALYVDPTDTQDIAKKITQLLEDAKLRHELIKKGYQHVKKFSWEKAAKETLEVLTEIGGRRSV